MAHHAKHKKNEPRQERRRRVLSRFSIVKMTPHPSKWSEDQKKEREGRYIAYVNRKNVELASLTRHVHGEIGGVR